MANDDKLFDALKSLGELKSKGHLTESEFEEQKKNLLSAPTVVSSISASIPSSAIATKAVLSTLGAVVILASTAGIVSTVKHCDNWKGTINQKGITALIKHDCVSSTAQAAPIDNTQHAQATQLKITRPFSMDGEWVTDWDQSVKNDPSLATTSNKSYLTSLDISIQGQKTHWKDSILDMLCSSLKPLDTTHTDNIVANCRYTDGSHGGSEVAFDLSAANENLIYNAGKQTVFLKKVSSVVNSDQQPKQTASVSQSAPESDNQPSQAAQDLSDEEIHNIFKSYIEKGYMVMTDDGTAYVDDSHLDSELSAHGKGYQCTTWQTGNPGSGMAVHCRCHLKRDETGTESLVCGKI